MKKQVLFFLLSLYTMTCFGQVYDQREFFSENGVLKYRVLYPKNYKEDQKYPLVLFLHGYGERGDDNEAQLRECRHFLTNNFYEKFPSIVLVPQCPKRIGASWANGLIEHYPGGTPNPNTYPLGVELSFNFERTTEPTREMILLQELIKEWESLTQIDTSRIYVGGLSMGAMGTYELLWRMPNMFTAAFPICGGVNISKITDMRKDLALWLFHGTSDNVVSFNFSKNAYQEFKNHKYNVRFTEYPGVQHASWINAFNEPQLVPWIMGEMQLEDGIYKISSLANAMLLTKSADSLSVQNSYEVNKCDWKLIKDQSKQAYRIYAESGFMLKAGLDIVELSASNPGDDSELWRLVSLSDGKYRIISVKTGQSLTVLDGQIALTEYEVAATQKWDIDYSRIYLVGTSTSAGWDRGKAIPLSLSEDGMLTWEGLLTKGFRDSGELKFMSTKDSWLPSINPYGWHVSFEGNKEYNLYLDKTGAADFKFKPAIEGKYRIKVDMKKMTIHFTPVYDQLYLVGEVISSGWDITKAQKMDVENGKYVWTGYLKSSSFKFAGLNYTFLPSFTSDQYNQVITTDGATQYDIKINDSRDFLFMIPKSGYYKIIVDLNTRKMTVNKMNYEKFWITGTALSGQTIELNTDVNSVFKYSGQISKGELKVMTTPEINSSTEYVVPLYSDASLPNSHGFCISKNANKGWIVSQDNPYYKLNLDMNSNTFRIESFKIKENVYIIGGATAVGWNIWRAIPLKKSANNPNEFVFEGELFMNKNHGESNLFKFSGQQNWHGVSIHPHSKDEPILTSNSLEEAWNGGRTDYKWSIAEDQQGYYKIVLDLFKESVKVEHKTKLVDDLYLFGPATDGGWDANSAKKMNKENDKFTWTGYLKADVFQFTGNARRVDLTFNSTTHDEIVGLDEQREHKLIYNGARDYKFRISRSGYYTISADLNNKLVTVKPKKINDLWITGSALDNKFVKLASGSEEGIFRFGGSLKPGNLRILTTYNISEETEYLNPERSGCQLLSGGKISVSTTTSNNLGWTINSASDLYKLTVDLTANSVSAEFVRLHNNLYLVGGATQALWNIYRGIPFKRDSQYPYIFKLQTDLKPSASGKHFKVMAQNNNWWGYSLHPLSIDQLASSKSSIKEHFGFGGPDYKWVINEDQKGAYILTVNLLNETLEMDKITSVPPHNKVLEEGNIPLFSLSSVNRSLRVKIKDYNGEPIKVQLLNLAGRVIVNAHIGSGESILAESLDTGVYVVKLVIDGQECSEKIFVK